MCHQSLETGVLILKGTLENIIHDIYLTYTDTQQNLYQLLQPPLSLSLFDQTTTIMTFGLG